MADIFSLSPLDTRTAFISYAGQPFHELLLGPSFGVAEDVPILMVLGNGYGHLPMLEDHVQGTVSFNECYGQNGSGLTLGYAAYGTDLLSDDSAVTILFMQQMPEISWFMVGSNLTFAAVLEATATYTPEDDNALIRSALKGDDNVFLSEGRDYFNGSRGNDFIYGNKGGDHLFGGAGDDTLRGGAGYDHLKGGLGNDVFLFADIPENSNILRGSDVIEDFQQGEDLIDLHRIDARTAAQGNQAFVFKGEAGVGEAGSFGDKPAGEVRFEIVDNDGNQDWTLIYLDTDADSDPEMMVALAGLYYNLQASDFIL